jgi:hypothetical protein
MATKLTRIPRGLELVPFKTVCRRMGIHPNTGYRLRQQDRFPLEVLEVGDRFYCRATDLADFTRARAAG